MGTYDDWKTTNPADRELGNADEVDDREAGRECQHDYTFSTYCGAHVCGDCGDHRGLARCYCGWSLTAPGQGRRELEDMGEQIDDDY